MPHKKAGGLNKDSYAASVPVANAQMLGIKHSQDTLHVCFAFQRVALAFFGFANRLQPSSAL